MANLNRTLLILGVTIFLLCALAESAPSKHSIIYVKFLRFIHIHSFFKNNLISSAEKAAEATTKAPTSGETEESTKTAAATPKPKAGGPIGPVKDLLGGLGR